MPRLRRTSPDDAGWTRRCAGRGFVYLDEEGGRLGPEQVEGCKELVIPPAWTDVWICPHPNGHLQAVGTDEAGRRQYIYHPAWIERRSAEKHERVVLLGRRLPALREGLFTYRDGRQWHTLSGAEVNDYVRETSGTESTAKDFRTWHGTVLAASALADA